MPDSTADYIIVGGGLTGCAIAARLHQSDSSLDVLVLEAGTDASDNPQTKDPAGAFALAGSELDYNYTTTPQPNTNDRTHNITAGKVLGGSSILNYGVWARGDALDYDQWATIVGDERWSYKGFLPFLKKAERHFNARNNSEYRGSDGPIRVISVAESIPKNEYGLREPLRAAWEELGLRTNPDGDCGALAGICELLESWTDGKRQASCTAYGLRASNVVLGAQAHKVVFTRDNEDCYNATGVLLTDGRQFKARREIILSAGTIGTPQILMLSGIGPGPLLSQYNIPVLFDNPEVGKNYFNHFALYQVWRLRNPEKGLSMGSPNCDDQIFNKGLPCDWAVNEGTPPNLLQPALNADVKSGKETDQSLLHPKRCLTETMVMYSPMGAPVPADGTFVTTSVMLLLPTSRGSLHIVSASPLDAPAIDPNFYDTETDRTALIHGVRRVMKALLGTSSGKLYIQNEEAPPDMPNLTEESSDADIDMRIRMTGLSHAHSAGTAATGKVVDSQLRVKGVKGLRIADASIFPTAIGGHPQATLYGVAEQAADILMQGG